MGAQPDRLTCRELVELVTEYLEGALEESRRQRFEEHIASCPACRMHLAQLQETISGLGALREADVPASARDELLEAFKDWNRGTG